MLLVRASAAIDQVEAVTRDADGVVVPTDAVVDRAEVVVTRSDGLASRLATLLDTLERPLINTPADPRHARRLGRIKRRIDEQQGEDETSATARD